MGFRSSRRHRASAHAVSTQGQGWLATRSLAFKQFFAASLVTVVVMAGIAAVVAWQTRTEASQAVQREVSAALAGVNESLLLVFDTSRDVGQRVIPVVLEELGGIPETDGSLIDSDDISFCH